VTRTLIVAALLLAITGYLIYPFQDESVATPSREKTIEPELPASGNNDIASDFVRSQLGDGVDVGELGSNLTDEDTPLHIGEFFDADNPPAVRSGEPLHIGEFVDPDSTLYATEDEAIHIGDDLSAYDPADYVTSKTDTPLHLGDDLSAYDPAEMMGGAPETEELHVGEPIDEPL